MDMRQSETVKPTQIENLTETEADLFKQLQYLSVYMNGPSNGGYVV